MKMKKLLLAAAFAILASSANAAAAERIPQQFIGHWCAADGDDITIAFRRTTKCDDAHEPESVMTILPDRLITGATFGETATATCKFLEIMSVVNDRWHGKSYRIKFWCKSLYQTWTYDAWFSAPGRNRILVAEQNQEDTHELKNGERK